MTNSSGTILHGNRQAQRITPYLSTKISFASFVYAVLVVVLHAHCIEMFNLTKTSAIDWAAYYLNKLISQDIARCAIPSFFAISGFLFFVKADDVKIVLMNVKKRVHTLFVPFVLAGILYFLLMMIPQVVIVGGSFAEYIGYAGSGLKAVYSIVFRGVYNAAGWYLFVLFGYSLISPLLYCVLKNKWGAIAVGMLIYLNGNLELLPIWKGKQYTLFFFYMGAFISRYAYDKVGKKANRWWYIAAICLFAAAQAIVLELGWYSDIVYMYPARFHFEILITISVWILIDLICSSKKKRFYGFSMAIYLAHPFLIETMKALMLRMGIGQCGGVVCILVYIGMSALGILIPIYFYGLLQKKAPIIYRLLTGGR